MKLKKYIVAGLIGIVSLGSCTYLDKEPDTEIDIDMVFENKTKVESWLANVYSRIPNPGNDWLNTYGWEVFADDLTASARWQQWDWPNITKIFGGWTPNTQWAGNFWDGLPRKIRQAYIFIERVHALPDSDLPQREVDYMKAEARFLAAYYWWQLLETYGPIPFRPNYIAPTDFTLSDLMVGQRPFDEIVSHLDNEMLEASKQLPAVWQSVEKYGRITSVMCLTVRAKMLLFAASPLVNGNEWYAGFKNYDGKFRFSQTYDPAKWKRAADANRELIEAAHAAGHDLVREYNADGSIDPFMSCYNVFFLRGDQNPEALFIRSDCNFSEFEKHATPRGASGNGGLGVYQTLVDAFAMKDGSLPITGYDGNYGKPIINKESGYTERGFSAQKDIRKTKYNLYRNCPGATVDSVGADGCTYNQVAASGTYNMYVGREPRFYLTVMWNRQWYHQAEREVQMMSNEQDGGPTHDAPQNGYLNRKKVSLDQNQRNGIHPYRPGILYRLGEAYLNYAEALNECDPGNPDILKYLNLIRERAGMPQYGTGKDSNGFDKIPLNGQDEVREAIYHERRVELCCENGLRYLDLRRWKKAEEVLNQPMYGMNFSGTKLSDDPNDDAAFFKRTQYIKRVYERKFYWYPIYQDQIDKDPTLVQAPFWDK